MSQFYKLKYRLDACGHTLIKLVFDEEWQYWFSEDDSYGEDESTPWTIEEFGINTPTWNVLNDFETKFPTMSDDIFESHLTILGHKIKNGCNNNPCSVIKPYGMCTQGSCRCVPRLEDEHLIGRELVRLGYPK